MQSSKGNSYAYVEVSRYHPRSKTGIKDPVPTKEIKLYEVMPRSRTNHRVTDYIFVVFLILIQRNVSQSKKVSQFIFWPRHVRLTPDYYRSQGKVMSLEACVSHSVHRGEGWTETPLWTETPFSGQRHLSLTETLPWTETPSLTSTGSHCSGRYASYWNAFLFSTFSCCIEHFEFVSFFCVW